MKRLFSLTCLLITVFALAACGDKGESTPAPLPTRMTLDETSGTAEATDNLSDTATAETTAMPIATISAELTIDPNAPPLGDLPPAVAQGTAAIQGEVTPDSSDAGLPPGIVLSSTTITDFSALTAGSGLTLSGELNLTSENRLTLTDTAGVVVEIDAPPGIVDAALYGQQAIVIGDVIAGQSEGTFTIRPREVRPLNADMTPGGQLPPGFVPEATDEAGNPLPPFITGLGAAQGEEMDFTVEADATALQTYDALIENLGDALDGLLWTLLTGNGDAGWLFEFYDETDETTVSYSVDAEGVVRQLDGVSNAPPLPGLEIYGIDRTRVVVDSDQVIAQGEQSEGPPLGQPSLILRATADGIEWTVMGTQPIVIDATVPQD